MDDVHNLGFSNFGKEHFEDYKSWFEDAHLNQALGGIDEEWLSHVLYDKEGVELAVMQDDSLVAVVGVVLPKTNHNFYTITNMAVKPGMTRRGLGSLILARLLNLYVLKPGEYWGAYVEYSNIKAQRFFEKNNWKRIDEDDMIRYRSS